MRILTRAMKAVLWLLLALFVSVSIGALALRYVVSHHFDRVRVPLERALGRLVQAQMHIGALQVQWQGTHPRLMVTQVTVYDQQGRLMLEVPRAVATLSWRTLFAWNPIFSDIYIDSPRAVVYRTIDDHLMIGDVVVPASADLDLLHTDGATGSSFLDDASSGLRWLLHQEALRIDNGQIDLYMPLYTGSIYHEAVFFPRHALQYVWGYPANLQQAFDRERLLTQPDLTQAGDACERHVDCKMSVSPFSSASWPSSIKAIHFALFSQGRDHQMGMQAQMEGTNWESPIDVRLHFQHSFWSKAANPKFWAGKGYVAVEAIPLRILNQLRAIPLQITEGTVSARNWFSFKKGHIHHVNGVLKMAEVRLHPQHLPQEKPWQLTTESATSFLTTPQNPPLPGIEIPHLSFGYTLRHHPAKLGALPNASRYAGEFTARFNDLVMELKSQSSVRRFQSAQTKIAFEMPSRQRHGRLTIEGDTLDLDFVSALMRPLVTDSAPLSLHKKAPALASPNVTVRSPLLRTSMHKTLKSHGPHSISASLSPYALQNLDIEGVLRHYRFDMQYPVSTFAEDQKGTSLFSQNLPRILMGAKYAEQTQYQLKADFERLTLLSHTQTPLGITRMSGSIDANERGGSLVLNTRDGAVSVPEGLSIPTAAFDVLKGRIEWALLPLKKKHLLTLKAISLFFSNEDGTGEINATYQKEMVVPVAFSHLVAQAKPIRLPSVVSRDASERVTEASGKQLSHLAQQGAPRKKQAHMRTRHAHSSDKGVLNLSLRIDRALVARVPRYLPSSLDKGLRTYLAYALRGGVTKDARLEIQGALDDFPFASAQAPGVFLVRAPFYEGCFDPSLPPASPSDAVLTSVATSSNTPSSSDASRGASVDAGAKNGKNLTHWPALEGLQGVLEIHRDALKISIAKGHYQDIQITEAQGGIPHLSKRTEDFLIKLRASGPLNSMLGYVKNSPIPSWTGHPKEALTAQGPALLDLQLRLPRQGAMQVGVEGKVSFLGNTIALDIPRPKRRLGGRDTADYALPPVTHLQGMLQFTESSLAWHSVTAQWLGGELQAEGSVDSEGSLRAEQQGQLAYLALRAWLQDSAACTRSCRQFMKHIRIARQERIPYQLSLQHTQKGNWTGSLDANLANIMLNWPAPFAKAKHKPMQLHLRVQNLAPALQASAPDKRVDIALGPIAAAYRLRSLGDPYSLNQYRVVSGALRIDTNADTNAGTNADTNVATMPAQSAATAPLRPTRSASKMASTKTGLPALVLPERGVVAMVRANYLDIDAWHPVFSADPAKQNRIAAGAAPKQEWPVYWPTRYIARIETMKAAQRAWHAVSLDATLTQGEWKVATTAREFAGQFEWIPHAGDPSTGKSNLGALKGHFLRLAIPLEEQASSRSSPRTHPVHKKASLEAINQKGVRATDFGSKAVRPDPVGIPLKDCPMLDLKVDALKIGERDLGQIAIVTRWTTEDNQPVWKLEKLQITNPDATFYSSGRWSPSAPTTTAEVPPITSVKSGYSAFDFGLDIQHAGALLTRFGIPKMLQGGMGKVEGQVQWGGMPERVDYDSLTGNLKLDLSYGRLLKAEPGVGNLLGALSLQSLLHLLVLDFRYLPGKGLAFSRVQGSAVIRNGVAYTEDFVMNSNPARITLTGNADLATRRQNLLLTVHPAINANSAVLAAAVLNPVLGLGSYIAQQVLSVSIGHNFLLHYAVSGSWDDPVVQRVHGDTLPQKATMLEKEPLHHSSF